MRPVQKTLVDFANIDAYARTVEFLHSKKAASDLRNIKQDILSAYDKQAPNYSALIVNYEDKTCTVSAIPHDYQL